MIISPRDWNLLLGGREDDALLCGEYVQQRLDYDCGSRGEVTRSLANLFLWFGGAGRTDRMDGTLL